MKRNAAAAHLIVVASIIIAALLLPERGSADTVTASDDLSSVIKIESFTVARNASGTQWTSCISFRNVSDRAIRAVQFSFSYFDAFDAKIAQFRADRVGEFAPGVLIQPGPSNVDSLTPGDNCWYVPITPGSPDRVIALTVKVRYLDGAIVALSPDARPSGLDGHLLSSAEHPLTIKCWLGITYDWTYAHQVPACKGAIKKWESEHSDRQVDVDSGPTSQPSP